MKQKHKHTSAGAKLRDAGFILLILTAVGLLLFGLASSGLRPSQHSVQCLVLGAILLVICMLIGKRIIK